MIVLSFILLIIQTSLLGNHNHYQVDAFDQTLFDWTGLWAEVAQKVKEKHYKVDSIEIEKAMSQAIDTFVSTLDPHSSFLDSKAYNAIMEKTSGEFCGIGIMINAMRSTKEKFLTIIEVIPDGPAAKSGIMQYDKIVEIESQTLEDMTTEEAISHLKGKKGTPVSVKILREGSPDLLSFTLTRDIVKEQQSLCFYIKDKNIYYLSLSTFAQNSKDQLEQLLKKAQKNNPKGLILDLRNNSGGLLNVAIDIAGLFLDKGSIVVTTKNNKNEIIETYKTTSNPIKNSDLLICILINNYTASAGEVLAGALQVHADKKDQKNPLLVFLAGTPTFGKGSVQEIMPIGKNCALKLTTSLYFLPYDTVVQGIGINPDICVERYSPPTDHAKWITESYGRENTLPHFISLEPRKDKKKKSAHEKKETSSDRTKQMLTRDNQLKEAINIISLIHHGQKNLRRVVIDRQTGLYFLKHNYACNDSLDIEEIAL